MAQCGTIGLPRVGTEVLVNFLGGDPDKPVIVGQLYNQQAQPPALSNIGDLPGNRYLSGIKSREIGGSRANRLALDDTKGEISAQLSSDHGTSQLNLGFLSRARDSGAVAKRGEGAELRSDESVAVRGAKGVLITASGQPSASDSMLSRAELISVGELSQQVVQQLATLAEKHTGDASDQGGFSALVGRVRNLDGSAGSSSDSTGAPVVAVSAPAGVFIGSPESVGICAKSTLDVVSAADIHVGSGKNLLMRATRGISMFAFKLGIKLVAASGNIRIESQDGDIEITSLKRIKLIANEGIELQSPVIKAVAQGCQVSYGGGKISQQSSGVHTIKSSAFRHEAGGEGTPATLNLPKSNVEHDQQVLVTDLITDEPVANRRYLIRLEDGQVFQGTTDTAGLTERFSTKVAFATYEIELLD